MRSRHRPRCPHWPLSWHWPRSWHWPLYRRLMLHRRRMIHLRIRPPHRPPRRLPMHLRLRTTVRRTIRRRCERTIRRRCERTIRRRGPYMPRTRRRMIVEGHRPRHRDSRRTPMIHPGKRIPVPPRHLLMLRLHGSRRNMPVPHRGLLRDRRPRLYPMRPAIIARPVHRDMIDHRPVDIRVAHHRRVDPGYRRVIPEMTTVPLATDISRADIPATIIDPTIKSYMRAPITCMPEIGTAGPSPITGRP